MNRIQEVEQKVAETLNQEHQKQADQVKKGRKDPQSFSIGEKVWYLHPEWTGEKKQKVRGWVHG